MVKQTYCEICNKLRVCLAVLIDDNMETWACRACIKKANASKVLKVEVLKGD